MIMMHNRHSGKMIQYMSCCMGIVLMSACSGSLEKDEYIRWIKDTKNGLHVTKVSNEFVFDLQYQPADYLRLQSGVLNKQQENTTDQLQYYMLSIGLVNEAADLIDYNVSDNSGKQEKLYYFSYRFQDDIYLEENGKRMPCVLFHFQRPQDSKHKRTFLLAFESQDQKSAETKFVINSAQFGALPVRMKVVKKNIPILKML